MFDKTKCRKHKVIWVWCGFAEIVRLRYSCLSFYCHRVFFEYSFFIFFSSFLDSIFRVSYFFLFNFFFWILFTFFEFYFSDLINFLWHYTRCTIKAVISSDKNKFAWISLWWKLLSLRFIIFKESYFQHSRRVSYTLIETIEFTYKSTHYTTKANLIILNKNFSIFHFFLLLTHF